MYCYIYIKYSEKVKKFERRSYETKQKTKKKILTPNAKDESGELRKVMVPARQWSEYRSDQNTKYRDIIAINIAWTVDMPLQNFMPIL